MSSRTHTVDYMKAFGSTTNTMGAVLLCGICSSALLMPAPHTCGSSTPALFHTVQGLGSTVTRDAPEVNDAS